MMAQTSSVIVQKFDGNGMTRRRERIKFDVFYFFVCMSWSED